MPPLSRPRRRRLMLLNESPTGNIVAEPVKSAVPTVIAQTAGTMQQQFLEDCGVPEGFDVEVTVEGRPEMHSVHVDEAFVLIGRDEECGVRLAGSDVGRHHAYVQAVAGQFVVIDLGSRTGIRQNGQPVCTALIATGEAVEIGPYTIRLVTSGGEFHEIPDEAQVHRTNPAIALSFQNQSKPVAPWTVDTPFTLIGSTKPSRIRLEHATVTPQHCAIIRGYRRWWVVDLNSQAGTIVDDVTARFAPLKVGTQLKIGRYQIVVQKPKSAEPVLPPMIDEGTVHTPKVSQGHPAQTPSVVDFTPTLPLTAASPGAPAQVVNEHLVVELFKEFAALHERTVSQMQQSFRELLEIATANRPAIAGPTASAPVIAAAAPAAVPNPEPAAPVSEPEDDEARIADLMHSEDPEERTAAQEILAAQMRSLEAKLRGESDSFAKRLLRSLSLTK